MQLTAKQTTGTPDYIHLVYVLVIMPSSLFLSCVTLSVLCNAFLLTFLSLSSLSLPFSLGISGQNQQHRLSLSLFPTVLSIDAAGTGEEKEAAKEH